MATAVKSTIPFVVPQEVPAELITQLQLTAFLSLRRGLHQLQEQVEISYERYGCMICETSERPHAGNGMCSRCRAKWFGRLTQIIKEGIECAPALRSRGATRVARFLPETASAGSPHRKIGRAHV